MAKRKFIGKTSDSVERPARAINERPARASFERPAQTENVSRYKTIVPLAGARPAVSKSRQSLPGASDTKNLIIKGPEKDVRKVTSKEMEFPTAWTWFIEELIPTYVKEHYSPKPQWKGKPFSEKDAAFFIRGIRELSDLFTEERSRLMPGYFQHPKFRSSYMLYFVPLQAAKILTLFQQHESALQQMLEHARARGGILRVSDLGAGPGTASIALLLWLIETKHPERLEGIEKIELHWCDTQPSILKDGVALVNSFAEQVLRLRGKVRVLTQSTPWWEFLAKATQPFSLSLFAHTLNEAPVSRSHARSRAVQRFSSIDADGETFRDEVQSQVAMSYLRPLARAVELSEGGGILFIEPADKRSSQLLSGIRDAMITEEIITARADSITGPCLHAGRCPLAMGRDWCHFSVPVQIPGKWFKKISVKLASERNWVKYSYLWLSGVARANAASTLKSEGVLSTAHASGMRRVISDPIAQAGNHLATLLLCEPEVPRRVPAKLPSPYHRGDLLKLEQED